MPRPGTWGKSGPDDGPGVVRDQCPGSSGWEPPLARYDFVEQFHALRRAVNPDDRGALERFDLWDAHMQFVRHVTLAGCDWSDLEACIGTIPAANASTAAARKKTAQTCLPHRHRLINSTSLLMNALLASVASTGTAGTVQNVVQHTFKECILLPAMTPLYEDIVLVKLWNKGGFLSADEIMAQGMLSFSELRNRPMLPRWFNFYGYDPNELK